MRNWTIAALCALASMTLATGCLIVDDRNDRDPPLPPPDVKNNQLDVTWQLLTGDSNATAQCPAEAVKLQLVILDKLGEQVAVDLFDCLDGGGLSRELDDGVYDVYINLMGSDDLLLAQSGVIDDVEVGPDIIGPVPLAYSFSIDRGSFLFAWELSDGSQPLTCADLDTSGVRISSTLIGETNDVFVDDFACTAGKGETKTLPLGDYTISAGMRDGQADVGVPLEVSGSLEFGNHYNELDVLLFDISQ